MPSTRPSVTVPILILSILRKIVLKGRAGARGRLRRRTALSRRFRKIRNEFLRLHLVIGECNLRVAVPESVAVQHLEIAGATEDDVVGFIVDVFLVVLRSGRGDGLVGEL